MRVVVQRAAAASAATLDGEPDVEIGAGLVLFVGFARTDDHATVTRIAHKIAHLRIFESDGSKFGRSLLDEDGNVLTISQFTLVADTSRGRRPNFSPAAPPQQAEELYGRFAAALTEVGVTKVVQTPFGSRHVVEVTNWGPFTMLVQS